MDVEASGVGCGNGRELRQISVVEFGISKKIGKTP
jgi:hypothetical protein